MTTMDGTFPATISNEIHASQLNPEKFMQIMNEYGSIIIRSLFTVEKIQPLIDSTSDLFYIVDCLRKHRLLTEGGEKHLWGGHPADILPNLNKLEEILDIENFIQSIKTYLKCSSLSVYAESTGVRYCEPTQWKNYIPWHQDLLDRSDNFLTCWMALSPVDDETPGLQLVPKKLHDKLHSQDGVSVTYGDGMTDEEVTSHVGTARIAPHFQVGDVILFDPYTVHRTHSTPAMTKTRLSIDIRFNPAEARPEHTWQTKVLEWPRKALTNETNTGRKREQFNLSHLVIPPLPTAAAAMPVPNNNGTDQSYIRKIVRGALRRALATIES